MLQIKENQVCFSEDFLQYSVIIVFCLSFIFFRIISYSIKKKEEMLNRNNNNNISENISQLNTNQGLEFDRATIDFFMNE
jgi:hypothetical protein